MAKVIISHTGQWREKSSTLFPPQGPQCIRSVLPPWTTQIVDYRNLFLAALAASFLASAEQITAVYHLPANISCPFMCTFSNSSKSRQVHYYLRMLTGTFQADFLVDYELHTISAYELGHLMLTRVSALTLNTARQTRETSMCKSSLLFYKYYCRVPQAKQ